MTLFAIYKKKTKIFQGPIRLCSQYEVLFKIRLNFTYFTISLFFFLQLTLRRSIVVFISNANAKNKSNKLYNASSQRADSNKIVYRKAFSHGGDSIHFTVTRYFL